MRAWCRPSLVSWARVRPASGARATLSSCSRTSVSSTPCTSSSRSRSAAATMPFAMRAARSWAWSGSASQPARRSTARAERRRSLTASALRKFSCTNDPMVSAKRSFRSTTMAVCGMGRPRGRRNRAVTANQSARPPTSDAIAAACTQLSQWARLSSTVEATKTAATTSNSPVARRLASTSRPARRCSVTDRGRAIACPFYPFTG